MVWLLLIYTVPSDPSRLRATVWRELKKSGAVYLRDGVAVLPERVATLALFQDIAAQITEFGGQATLVEGAQLDREREAALIAEVQAARAGEFAEIQREVERLLTHVQQERTHRTLTATDLAVIAADFDKLRRWAEQVRARDAFGAPTAAIVDTRLRDAEEILDAFRTEIDRQPVRS